MAEVEQQIQSLPILTHGSFKSLALLLDAWSIFLGILKEIK